MTPRRTRVLIEHENPLARDTQAAELETAGFEVTTCPGPASLPGGVCPLVAHGCCDKAFAADVIVDGLPLGQLRVYVAQRAYLPDCPVLLGLSEAEKARHPVLDYLTTSIRRNATGSELVDAVRAVADRRSAG